MIGFPLGDPPLLRCHRDLDAEMGQFRGSFIPLRCVPKKIEFRMIRQIDREKPAYVHRAVVGIAIHVRFRPVRVCVASIRTLVPRRAGVGN